MSQEEKLVILKSCIGKLFSLHREMRQKLDYSKEGASESNVNLIIGSLCGLEQLNQRIKSIYDMMIFIQRL